MFEWAIDGLRNDETPWVTALGHAGLAVFVLGVVLCVACLTPVGVLLGNFLALSAQTSLVTGIAYMGAHLGLTLVGF